MKVAWGEQKEHETGHVYLVDTGGAPPSIIAMVISPVSGCPIGLEDILGQQQQLFGATCRLLDITRKKALWGSIASELQYCIYWLGYFHCRTYFCLPNAHVKFTVSALLFLLMCSQHSSLFTVSFSKSYQFISTDQCQQCALRSRIWTVNVPLLSPASL